MKENLLRSGYYIIQLIVQNCVVLRIVLRLAVSLNAPWRCKAFPTKVTCGTLCNLHLIPMFHENPFPETLCRTRLLLLKSSKLLRHWKTKIILSSTSAVVFQRAQSRSSVLPRSSA